MALHKDFPDSPYVILAPGYVRFRPMRPCAQPVSKKDRSLELTSVYHECLPGRRKLAVKVVDIFGNDTMTIVDVNM